MARILLVDDDDALRTAMCLALELDGHRVTTAATAGAAIRSLDERAPDIVVSDVYLPGSGLTVLERARRCAHPVPVVMITGQPSPDLRERVRRRGAALEVKPIDLQRFRRVIAQALDEH